MSKAWKDLEKKVAFTLGGTRINRANDYGISDVDVVLSDFDFLRIDCKYRKSHAHHSFVEEIRTKYCTGEHQYPVLVTKHHSSRREYVTVDLVLFAALLEALRNTNENKHENQEDAEAVPRRKELDQGNNV